MPAAAPPPTAACAALAARPEVLLRAAAAGRAGSPLVGGHFGGLARASSPCRRSVACAFVELRRGLALEPAHLAGLTPGVDTLFAPLAWPVVAGLARGVAVKPKATYFTNRW